MRRKKSRLKKLQLILNLLCILSKFMYDIKKIWCGSSHSLYSINKHDIILLLIVSQPDDVVIFSIMFLMWICYFLYYKSKTTIFVGFVVFPGVRQLFKIRALWTEEKMNINNIFYCIRMIIDEFHLYKIIELIMHI